MGTWGGLSLLAVMTVLWVGERAGNEDAISGGVRIYVEGDGGALDDCHEDERCTRRRLHGG
jgi:hypothetical protein